MTAVRRPAWVLTERERALVALLAEAQRRIWAGEQGTGSREQGTVVTVEREKAG